MQNEDNEQTLEVRSNNVDQHGVTFHALLYKLLTPTLHNVLTFDNVVVNSPTLRPFTVQSVTDRPLTLGKAWASSPRSLLGLEVDFLFMHVIAEMFTSKSPEIRLFVKGTQAQVGAQRHDAQ